MYHVLETVTPIIRGDAKLGLGGIFRHEKNVWDI